MNDETQPDAILSTFIKDCDLPKINAADMVFTSRELKCHKWQSELKSDNSVNEKITNDLYESKDSVCFITFAKHDNRVLEIDIVDGNAALVTEDIKCEERQSKLESDNSTAERDNSNELVLTSNNGTKRQDTSALTTFVTNGKLSKTDPANWCVMVVNKKPINHQSKSNVELNNSITKKEDLKESISTANNNLNKTQLF